MKYKFTVDYIHNSFIEAHPTMHENHPDFIKATSTSIYELDHAEEVSLEVAQNMERARPDRRKPQTRGRKAIQTDRSWIQDDKESIQTRRCRKTH